jgi:hypothetical protein
MKLRHYFWDIVLSGFFAVLVIIGLSYLNSVHRLPGGVSFADLFLMALAIFRLVRLFTYDHITKFLRDYFAESKKYSLGATLGALLNCPWCTGLWFSAVVVFVYFATPYAWPIILLLALAALGSFFMILANLVGWHAEGKKRSIIG